MSYFVTSTISNNGLAQAIESREFEIADYQKNEAVLQAILAGYADLGDWPEHLIKYKNVADSRVLAQELLGNDLELAGKLQHRERVTMELSMSQIERRKSEAILNALVSSVSEAELATIIETYKASK